MVSPNDFGFNSETGTDNEFQHKPNNCDSSQITTKALTEFEQMVAKLDSSNIEVTIVKNKPSAQKLPDAVFPNNWFSTRADGTLFIYPMKAANRQAEVKIKPLLNRLTGSNYQVKNVIDLRATQSENNILEGTGSLIFHHPSSKIFAAYSERCKAKALASFSQSYGYLAFPFKTLSDTSKEIYHTNVLMSCGLDFAVITKSCLVNSSQSDEALVELSHTVSDVIEIDQNQMSQHFCGNIIQLIDKNNQSCIVMSHSAYQGFNNKQRKTLEKHGSLIVCNIPTIEYIGGGSARCMIAENFLPRLKSTIPS